MINEYDSIDLDNAAYQQVSLGTGYNTFYLIAISQEENIKSVTFSVAIDSGVTGNPLVLNNITLPIEQMITGIRCDNYPEDFYLKPVQVVDKDENVLTEGEYDIEINIEPVSLG